MRIIILSRSCWRSFLSYEICFSGLISYGHTGALKSSNGLKLFMFLGDRKSVV